MSNRSFVSIFLLFLIVFVALGILWKDFLRHRKKIMKNADAIVKLQNNPYEQRIVKLKNSQKRFSKIYNGLIKKSLNIEDRRKLCQFLTEESDDRGEVADGYNCLSKIEQDKNTLSSSLHAITYSSWALEAKYEKEYAKDLARIIVGADREEVSKIFSESGHQGKIDDFITGNTDHEISLLTKLAQSNNKQLKLKSLFRLSQIYNWGRSSSLANIEHLDLTKSFEYQKEAFNLSGIQPLKQTNVGLVFNDRYAPYALTTIASILLNSDFENKYNFYIVDDPQDPLSKDNIQKIEKLKYIRPFNIQYLSFPEEIIEQNKEIFKIQSDRFPRLIFFRIYMHELLKNLDNIITLDVDIIVKRDLHELQKKTQDNNGIMFGAVVDSMSTVYRRILRKHCLLENFDHYINVGVMSLNLKNMREDNLSKAIYDRYIINDCKKPLLPEQDIINNTLSEEKLLLPERWNSLDISDKYSEVSFMPFIKHFNGIKPWSAEGIENKNKIQHDSKHILLWWRYQNFVDSILNYHEK